MLHTPARYIFLIALTHARSVSELSTIGTLAPVRHSVQQFVAQPGDCVVAVSAVLCQGNPGYRIHRIITSGIHRHDVTPRRVALQRRD